MQLMTNMELLVTSTMIMLNQMVIMEPLRAQDRMKQELMLLETQITVHLVKLLTQDMVNLVRWE